MTSLRPRPVTATVTKPSWMQPEAIVGRRPDSPDSRGSTASLTSVLDHESCESLSEDEIDRQVKTSLKNYLFAVTQSTSVGRRFLFLKVGFKARDFQYKFKK